MVPSVIEDTNESVVEHYGIEWPVSIYDRPMLALSNVLLRGDVDAATRAIFTPDTLSPNEMKTLTARFAGKKPGKLVKTILDVATNPLVIAGLVGGYLLWPAAGTGTLAELYMGLRKAVPQTGLLGRWVGASYTRLRHLPGLHSALKDVESATAGFVEKWHLPRVEAYGELGKAVGEGGVSGHRMSAWMQGWHKASGELKHLWGIEGPISPGLQGKMTAAEISASAKMRNVANAMWDETVAKHPEALKELKALAKERGVSLGKFKEDYFPHMVRPNEWQRTVFRNSPPSQFRQPLSANLLSRPGRSIPDPNILRAMEARGEMRAGFADELLAKVDADVESFRVKLSDLVGKATSERTLKKEIRDAIGLKSGQNDAVLDAALNRILPAKMGVAGESLDDAVAWSAKMLRYPGTYTLDFDPVWTRYVAKMAPTYAWDIAPSSVAGQSLGQRVQKMIGDYKAKRLLDPGYKGGGMGPTETYLKNQLIPMQLGQMTTRQYSRAQKWAAFRLAKADWLKTSTAAKMIPDSTRQWMIRNLEDLGSLDAETIGHGINEYLYLSTMGANIGPASKNIFQNPLTFINLPGMGMGAWSQGVAETFKRGSAYLADIPKLGAQKSFETHFKDFIQMLGPRTSIIERMFGTQAHVGMPATGVRGVVGRVKDIAMAPFQFSELWVNRMPAFYGAKARALQWGKTEAEALKMAGNIVDISHFTGGPMGMPSGIMDWWAPWRQFMQFPTRIVDFMLGSTRMGANPGKLDFGTLSRMLAASAGAYTVGKDLLGADVSQGLLAGALPLPQYPNAAFFPAPLVPPVVQMAGNVVKGIATGEPQPIADTATLLVPGGLAAKRLIKTLGPKRADYDNRLADGRIPVYNDQGRLIGAYSPLQLGMRALGIMPGDVAAERAAAGWLVKQRDQIRQYRQKWLDAQIANDPVKAEAIQREFQTQYPELGRMEFKKSDINSIRQRRESARLARIVRGFPRAYKPLFENILTEAQLGGFTQGAPQVSLPTELAAME